MRLAAEAPAKINRELRVGRLRPDGYHEILSRMVSIDLADRLTAEPSDALEFSCDDPSVPAGEDNLVVRAARRLAARAGVRAGAR
ncbi:MAG TPA: 4-(cytidine 5'-diphospho)-2-C-methyl-D-erythritol kinase, partial [Thermoanaerobaculia bacterium]|nr:4-(cytidine 5'-diphospho)-2-C-methyl-D-erythritol kinase [Thermoanaerobaculia bacterium]